jgi:hypothetical protein
LNVSLNRNKVTKLYDGQPIDDIGRGGNRVMEGEPIGIFYGYNWLGVDPTTGSLVYEDVNKDGQLTNDDRMKIGDPNPDFYGGINNTFTFNSFDLNLLLTYSIGNDIFNGMRIYAEQVTGIDNQLTTVLTHWTKPGDITNIPLAGDTYASSRFIEDGSYLKVKNITLGYKLPKRLASKLNMRSLRAFVTVQNLYTFTPYTGMDPEVNYAGNDNLRLGTDFYTYPQARSFVVGISLGF